MGQRTQSSSRGTPDRGTDVSTGHSLHVSLTHRPPTPRKGPSLQEGSGRVPAWQSAQGQERDGFSGCVIKTFAIGDTHGNQPPHPTDGFVNLHLGSRWLGGQTPDFPARGGCAVHAIRPLRVPRPCAGSPSPPAPGAHRNVSNTSSNPCLTRKRGTFGRFKYCCSGKYVLLNYKAPVS